MTTYQQIVQEVYKTWIVKHTQKLVNKAYKRHPEFERLLRPVKTWTNRDYESLSAISEIDTTALKRVLGYSKRRAQVSPKNEKKIINFLGYTEKKEEFTNLLISEMYNYMKK